MARDDELPMNSKDYTENDRDVELFQDAALESLTENGITASLKSIKWDDTPENRCKMKEMICEDLERDTVTDYGAQQANKNLARLRHIQFSEMDLHSALSVLDAAAETRSVRNGAHRARHSYPVDASDGKLNNNNSLVQELEDRSLIREVDPTEKAAQFAALDTLRPKDLAWRTAYEAGTLLPATTKAEAGRRASRAYRLKRKVEMTYNQVIDSKANVINSVRVE